MFLTQTEETYKTVSIDVIDSSSSAIMEGNSAVSRTKTRGTDLESTWNNYYMDIHMPSMSSSPISSPASFSFKAVAI